LWFAIDILAVSLKGDLDLLLVLSSHIPDADLGREVFRHLYESLSLQRVRMGEDHWPSSVGPTRRRGLQVPFMFTSFID
jgi:hypothetical protein